MCHANERRRYIVTSSFIGWAHTQNHFWVQNVSRYPLCIQHDVWLETFRTVYQLCGPQRSSLSWNIWSFGLKFTFWIISTNGALTVCLHPCLRAKNEHKESFLQNHTNGLDCSISSAFVMEILQSCSKPFICPFLMHRSYDSLTLSHRYIYIYIKTFDI